MPGIADVAALAGVSKATASRALSGAGYVSAATKDRVTHAAQTLGYVPSTSAVSLATGRTQNIGVVMAHVNRWYFAEVLEGIQQALLEHGLDLTLYGAQPGTAGRDLIFTDFLARKRFDGLIAVGVEPETQELQQLIAIGRPVVSVVGSSLDTDVIAIDDGDAARRATEHLLALGHTAIAFIGGDEASDKRHVDCRRRDGYRAAMSAAGHDAQIAVFWSELSMPDGYLAAVDALGDARNRPTGLVAVCDEVAIGAIIAARRLGIHVPGELSVIGIDDHDLADMFSLTTFRQRPREQGAAAVDLLLARISDPDREPQPYYLPTRLVVRSSTSSPPENRPAPLGGR